MKIIYKTERDSQTQKLIYSYQNWEKEGGEDKLEVLIK